MLRRRYAVAGVFVLLGLLYTAPALLPGRVFAPVDIAHDFAAWKSDPHVRVRVSNSLLSDVVVQFIPWDAEIVRMLAEGQLPWRNGWAAGGAPLFANPQTAMFSPFTWPRLLFGLHGWVLCAILRIVSAGVLMAWLAYAMGATRAQAVLSGFVYATCGYATVWLLYPHMNVFAVVPGLAAASLRLMREPRLRWALLVTFFAALATAGGHPETLFVSVIAIAVFLVLEARAAQNRGALIPITIMSAGGFLLLGIQLVPFLELLFVSDARAMRSTLPLLGFRWTGIVAQVVPGFLGAPLRNELDLTALLPVPENFTTRSMSYIGFITLIAIALSWKRLTPIFRRGLVIGVVALIVSWRLPLLTGALRHVPVLGWTAVEYWTVPFVLFASAAAGPAIASLLRARRAGLALIVAGTLLVLGGIVVAAPPARPTHTGLARNGIERLRARGALPQAAAVYEQRLATYLAAAELTAIRRAVLPGLCWIVAGIALWAERRRLFAAAVAAELIAFGFGFNPAVARDAMPPAPPSIEQVHRFDPTNEWLIASHRDAFPSNLGTTYHVRDVASYDVLTSATEMSALREAGYDAALHSFPAAPTPQQITAMERLGVRYFVDRTVHELPHPYHPAPPRNDPPEGLGGGIALTVLGALIVAAMIGLYRM